MRVDIIAAPESQFKARRRRTYLELFFSSKRRPRWRKDLARAKAEVFIIPARKGERERGEKLLLLSRTLIAPPGELPIRKFTTSGGACIYMYIMGGGKIRGPEGI